MLSTKPDPGTWNTKPKELASGGQNPQKPSDKVTLRQTHGSAELRPCRSGAVTSLVPESTAPRRQGTAIPPAPLCCEASLPHTGWCLLLLLLKCIRISSRGALHNFFYFAKLHFLLQKPYFDVNLVNRGPVRSTAEHKSSSTEVA